MLFFLGIHALARQWNAVIIGSTRKDILIKPDSRRHVVGRGVLTRKDLAILMRGHSAVDDGQSLPTTPATVDKKVCETPLPGECRTDLQSCKFHL